MSIDVERKREPDTAGSASLSKSGGSAGLIALLTWCAIALLAAFSIWSIQPPAPVPASASPDVFSADRAMTHVRAIATTPHPIGSAAQKAVRQYLVDRLTSLGLNPQVYSSVGINVGGTKILAGEVQNIVGRLQGSANSGAVLLMAHYDSVKHAPGAADDGAGIATILETLSALRSDPPLKNDVIVLFTDGEEAGLLGAEAFVAGHAGLKDIGVILNFEARGDQGPSFLFETSADNGKLMDEVRESTPNLEGSSFFYSLYKTMPNDTDLTLFRPSNIPSLNFAFGNRFEAYHTRLDTPENLSAGSLQLHGAYALSLTRRFGRLDLAALRAKSGDDVFFNLAGKRLIAYPQSRTIIIEIVITLLLFAAFLVALRRHEVSGRGLLLSFPAMLSVMVALPLTMAAAWWVVSDLLSLKLLIGDTWSNNLLLIGLLLLGAAAADLLLRRYSRSFNRAELFFAGLAFLWILSWVLVILMPAGSYLLQLPLALLAPCLVAAQLFRRTAGRLFTDATLPGSIGSIFMFAPLLYLVYVFLALSYVVVIAAGFLLAVFVLFSTPVLSIATVKNRPWFAVSGILALTGIGCLALGAVRSQYSDESPKPDNLLYSLDAGRQSAAWISFDRVPDGWVTSTIPADRRRHQPMPDYLANSPAEVWTVPAPALDLPAPLIEVVSDETSGDLRHLVLTLRSQRDAGLMYTALGPNVTIVSAKIAGREVSFKAGRRPAPATWSMALYGWGQQGIRLEMEIKSTGNPTLWVADESPGLPLSPPQRPSNLIAWYGSDVTLVNSRLTFGEKTAVQPGH